MVARAPPPQRAGLAVDIAPVEAAGFHDDASRSAPGGERRWSHPTQSYLVRPRVDVPGEVLLCPDGTDHVVITSGGGVDVLAADAASGARLGVRVVRQVLMRGGERAGGRCVHAAVARVGNLGVLDTGAPGAGKTSVLTELISTHRARPVANDRAVLVPTGQGRWRAYGVPLVWRFTPQAVVASPRLSGTIASGRRERGDALVDGKAEFTPQEVARLFGTEPPSCVDVDLVVVLNRRGHQGAALSAGLTEALDFGVDDPFSCDWLALREVAGLSGNVAPQDAALWWRTLAADLRPLTRTVTWESPQEFPVIADVIARFGGRR
jgi:hypothetical protein